MKFLKIAGKDIKSIAKNRFIRVSVVAILIVPLLYSLLYLAAFWDPYSKLQEVPVAVVNLDSGTTLDGENVNYGEDILDELKTNDELGWKITTLEDANTGLEGDKYYAKVIIPKEFSEDVIKAKSSTPKEATISFTCNDKKNFLASQINSKVQSELKASITKTISSNYVEVAFNSLYEAKDGFVQAADGSNQIYDGLSTLNGKVPELSSGITALSDGSSKLVSGQEQLNNGISELNSKLNGGASDLKKLSEGAKVISLASTPISKGGEAISSNYDKINSSYSQINAGVNELASNVTGTMTDISSIGSNIQKLLAQNPKLIQTQEMQDILKTLKKMDEGKDTSKAKLTALVNGSNELKAGMGNFKDGINSYTSKVSQFAQGSNELSNGTLLAISNLNEMQKGVGLLNSGSNELLNGQKTLNSGVSTLSGAVPELKTGVEKLTDGTKELKTKLNDGANKMKDGLVNSSEVMGEYVSSPLDLKAESINPVTNYGTGFAPYFIPLSLWIGAIMMFFVIPSKVDDEENATRFDKVFGKFLSFGVVGILQAILVSVVVLGLGLTPTNVFAYFMTNIFLSLVFISIIQCFIFLFGDAGRLFSIVLLILQLTSCAGTFPLEVVPNFFKAMNPYMPFTYAVEALREVISATTINTSVLFNDFMILGSVLVVFLTISVAFKNVGEKVTEAIEGKKAA